MIDAKERIRAAREIRGYVARGYDNRYPKRLLWDPLQDVGDILGVKPGGNILLAIADYIDVEDNEQKG